MAFGHGAGGEVQKPLATVVIGGIFNLRDFDAVRVAHALQLV